MLVALVLALQIAIPEHHGLVNDTAHMLTSTTITTLENQLRTYEAHTTNEIAVLIIPTLNGVSIEEYANRVFHTWGIGKNDKDNGVLFVWSTGDRKLRIEVGYGLEPELTDGRAGQIIREVITPQFRAERWDAGVQLGVNAILLALQSSTIVQASVPPSRTYIGPYVIILVVAIGLFAVVAWLWRRKRRNMRASADDFSVSKHSLTPYHQATARQDDHIEPDIPIVIASSDEPYSSSPSSSNDYSPPSTDFSFGGGDAGGGGASGDY